MSAHITQVQKSAIISQLKRDRLTNLHNLELYLGRITSNQPVDFVFEDGTTLEVAPDEAWKVIAEWGASSEANLPVGESGSMQARARRLLSHIQVNLIGLETLASAGHYQIMEQAKHPVPHIADSSNIPLSNFEMVSNRRRVLLDAYEAKVLGKFRSELEKTKYIQQFQDPYTRSLLSAMFAADAANLRKYSDETAGHVNQLLLHQAGVGEINNAMHLAYSEAGEADLQEISNRIETVIQSVYGKDDAAFDKDREQFRIAQSLAPSIYDVSLLVEAFLPTAPEAEKKALKRALKTTILSAAHGKHVDGRKLLTQALQNAGFVAEASAVAERLSAYIEEIEIKSRHDLLDVDIFSNDPKEKATLNITNALGVEASIPWMKAEDLKSISEGLVPGSFDKPELIAEALRDELAKGSRGDVLRISQLKNLYDKSTQYRYFNEELNHNPLLAAQTLISKATGNWNAITDPIDKVTTKVWSGIHKVDDFISWPARKSLEAWEKLGERLTTNVQLKNGKVLAITWLDPMGFAYRQWIGLQKGVALRIFTWSANIVRRNPTGWYAGMFRQVADFSRSFYKSDADWAHAGFLFVERKWGNVLNWSTQRLFNKSWGEAKIAFAEAAWSGFARLAPGLAAKMAGSAAGKLLATFLAGELTAGTSLIIQAGLMAVGAVFKGIIRFFRDAKFRNDFINRIPLMVGAAVGSLLALPAAALAAITAAIPAVLGFIASLFSGLLALFMQSFLWVGVGVMSLLLLYQVVKLTSNVDPGTALFTAVFCNKASSTTSTTGGTTNNVSTSTSSTGNGGNAVASCASCLVDYLTACYGKSVNSQTMSTNGVGCLLAKAVAPNVADIIERSATSFTYLQCVGFVQASLACAGGNLPGANACSYADSANWGDYKFVSGLNGAKQGDPVVFRSSGTCSGGAPGHIGILNQDAGSLVCLIDANSVCNGCVSGNNCLPKTNVAGYLRKI